MRTPIWVIIAAIFAQFLLSGCGSRQGGMFQSDAPNEFAVVPTSELQLPQELPSQLADLPAPAPGAPNRVDVAPDREIAGAFGGTDARPSGNVVPGSDRALVRAAGRSGIEPDIRVELAAADRAFRSENRARPLDAMLGSNNYYRIYEDVMLDAYAEMERLRAEGVDTPTAPPERENADSKSPLVFVN